jgi:hypothetical protein
MGDAGVARIKRSEIRERPAGLNAYPGFRYARSGYALLAGLREVLMKQTGWAILLAAIAAPAASQTANAIAIAPLPPLVVAKSHDIVLARIPRAHTQSTIEHYQRQHSQADIEHHRRKHAPHTGHNHKHKHY